MTWRTKCIDEVVLRIWVEIGDNLVSLRLEGKVVGPWVEECQRAWDGVRAESGARKVRLDVSGMTYVDERGMAMLRQIRRISGAEVVASSPLTKYFAERITMEIEQIETEGG